MNHPSLHLPVDFEMRDDLRRLTISLENEGVADAKDAAAIYFVRIWCDWARCAVEWRALDHPFAGSGHPFETEAIVHILEQFCRWEGNRGHLVELCIKSGVLGVCQNGDLWGLTLKDFWRFNEHLSPDYKTQQQRGGIAKAAKRRAAQVEEMAGQQGEILKRQGQLAFSAELKVKPEEEKRAVAFIMRMDRACGVPVRASVSYLPALLQRALELTRTYANEQITLVEQYLHKHRSNPEVVKIPDRVIQDFDDYYRRAE